MSAPPAYAEADPEKYPQQPQPSYQQYYAPPAAPQPQPVGGQQNTVVVTVPRVQLGTITGSTPVQTMCTNCQQSIVTSVSYDTGALTWLIAAILCFVGCWPCACIPFCIDDCKDVVHTCPSCNVVLGRYRRL